MNTAPQTYAVRTRAFDWDFKEHGWRPAGCPDFDAGNAFLTTHDVFEHFDNSEDFAKEMLAFGSILYGRMRVEQSMHAHVLDLGNFLMQQHQQVKPCPARWKKPLADTTDERNLQGLMFHVKQGFELAYMFGQVDSLNNLGQMLDDVAGWIRLGYRIAAKRFKGHSRVEVVKAFREMEAAIEMDHWVHPPHKYGRLVVQFCPATLTFNLIHGATHQQQHQHNMEAA